MRPAWDDYCFANVPDTGRSLFGNRDPSDRLLDRCPGVLVVPDEGFAWYDDGHLSYVGMHGGMHPDEMLVPFAAARVDALQG